MEIMEMRETRQGWNLMRAEGDDGNCSSRIPGGIAACSVTIAVKVRGVTFPRHTVPLTTHWAS